MTSYGGYLNYRARSRDSVFVFNAGVRYSQVELYAKYDSADLDLIAWPAAYTTTGVSVKNDDLTWGSGITVNTKDNWQLSALVSTAFRSPNIDDFAKLRVKNQYAVLPNTELKPERSIGGEMTIGKQFGQVHQNKGASLYVSGTGFYTQVSDAIVRRLGVQPNGDSTILVENEPNPLFIVQQNFNANTAKVHGWSANMKVNVKDHWILHGSINKTTGRTTIDIDNPEDASMAQDTVVPMAHIPPVYGRLGLRYQAKKFKIEGVMQFSGAKPLDDYAVTGASYDGNKNIVLDRGGSSDNLEYTPFYIDENGEEQYIGSLAWKVFNIYSSFKLSKAFSIDLAVENIFDQHYIPFSSGVSAPGTNFIVTLRGSF